MNTSNTKLTKLQKDTRKFLLDVLHEQGGEIFSFPENNCTVAVVPEFTNSNMLRVSVSYMSDKWRNKVGEFFALEKLFDTYECIKLPFKHYDKFEIANNIAQLCD